MFNVNYDWDTIDELHAVIMTAEEAEEVLKNKSIGAYVLREDPTGLLYLSGVHIDGLIHHARIEKEPNFWLGFNGGDYRAKTIYKADSFAELVPICLGCEKEKCQLINLL